ncbi:MAG: M23 family metallopeptidase, partial [Candidatus Dojkabacteria bacterium]|nr:M23 family metallopeptidase [Candidatus Dojkabacteria bacterium]
EIGDEIQTGDVIGTVGNTGYVRGNPDQPVGEQGCHLHFEIRSNEDIPLEVYGVYPIDPELLIMYSDNESPLILSIGDALALGYGHGAVSPEILKKLEPVHRYLNNQYGSTHFYTINSEDRDTVIENSQPGGVWDGVFTYEGAKYCAFKSEATNTDPVFRFRNNDVIGTHFYTISSKGAKTVIKILLQVVFGKGLLQMKV